MARLDPAVLDHLEWIGFVQPTGLVVSAPALVRAGAILDRRDTEGQQLLEACVEEKPTTAGDSEPYLPDFRAFASNVLGWNFSPNGYAGTDESQTPPELEVSLPDYGETLRPDYAVRELDPGEDESSWQLIVKVLETGESLERAVRSEGKFEASPHGRMERLLRETSVPAGLLFNGHTLRLISAPRGESSGWIDFKVAEMLQTAGRPISTAMRLLLREQRLLALPRGQRLAALLAESRKFQNEVSERLSEQVLHALYELLRGFQGAHDHSGGQLLNAPLDDDPDEVYRAMLTVILRLVFLLYAEERDMLPQDDDTFIRSYSVTGLYERLREDAALYPDTMGQRFGAWAQLLVLFRLIHDGGNIGGFELPPRHGALFDPDRYKFLEGRAGGGARQTHQRIDPPLMSDATVWRVLEDLLVLDGERISYRSLDVEQIGSVYETMMGFRLETATGRSVAIRPQKRHGAPATVDLEAALAQPSSKRGKWLADNSYRKLTPKVSKAAAAADSLEDLHAALLPIVDRSATPDLVPKGAMVLQPSEERRRSGSHYTPRTLTEPIVRTTLEPVLAQLTGDDDSLPSPDQILDLKVCDPAMGSGAFLVETCRQLGDALVKSWRVHGEVPDLPADEDEVVFARRLVAQRCLYGVDRNPVATDLAKMSLWLITLARDHSFTFLDHALRHGDSLVGLSNRQIENFHWDVSKTWDSPFRKRLRDHVAKIADLRGQIREAGEDVSDWELRDLWDEANAELENARLYGDLVVAAYFEGGKAKERESRRDVYVQSVSAEEEEYRTMLDERRQADPPLAPFHWELEFPEVFNREAPGFDSIVGNPPFGGHVSVVSANLDGYTDWLRFIHPESTGKCDVVAHFFRRSFDVIREGSTLGLIATNTIAQGDTRASGLTWICNNGGHLYSAIKRYKWPGMAAVVVSVIHLTKGKPPRRRYLNGREVDKLSAFLFTDGGHDDPARLASNANQSFQGSILLGMGFTFDDTDKKGVASSIAEMEQLTESNPARAEVIFPYIGGEEVNNSPDQTPHRYVIDFGELSEEESRRRWPKLMDIVEERVKPFRLESARKSKSSHAKRAAVWWQHYHQAKELYRAINGMDRVLATSRVSHHHAIALLPSGMVYSDSLVLFPFSSFAAFCSVQSQPHEAWTRFFGSSMKDDLRYTPSDCFETFPFPEHWERHPDLEAVGSGYYEFRAALMVANNEGLTTTYNRFHNPEERDSQIAGLRDLHAQMDRAVLDAYGWTDIPNDCDFFLDYEINEEEWGKKKKPWRYRWPDEVRDEVLARLLALNRERAAAEARAGETEARLFE